MAGRPGCPRAGFSRDARRPFVVTNSLTKAWGLPGLRVGWVAADPAIAERVRRVRDLLDVIGAFPRSSSACSRSSSSIG